MEIKFVKWLMLQIIVDRRIKMKTIGNVFILGDSISTFEGYIPEGNWCWYFKSPQNDTDVCDVNETWWKLLLEATDSNMVLNCSFSGSTLCHTGYDGSDWSEYISFSARLLNLIKEDFFAKNKIDTFFIFGGTNDSWANSPLGEIKYGPKSKEDLFNVLPAYCYIVEAVKEHCKNARIITIVNTDVKPEIANCFDEVSKHYGTEIIKLRDIEKQNGHPNKTGMQQIFTQVLDNL